MRTQADGKSPYEKAIDSFKAAHPEIDVKLS